METETRANGGRRRSRARIAYFVAGLLVTLAAFAVSVRWNDAVEWLSSGSLGGVDAHPAWLLALAEVVAALSWVVGGFLLVFRLWGRRNVHVEFYLLGVVATWAVLIGWFLFGGPIDDYVSRVPFESAAWKADDTERGERPDRQRMIHDLLERGLLGGVSTEEVARILGPADMGRGGPEGEFTYALGPDRGIGIDTELLVVRFDARGNVAEVFLRTD